MPSGLDISAIDKSANPCDDFYQYACGGWMKANPIPADESSWGSFDVLHQRNEKVLHDILDDSSQHLNRSQTDQQIGAFYKSCMNEEHLNLLGRTPLNSELDRIGRVRERHDLLSEIVHLHKQQVEALFNFSSSPDPNNAKQAIANLDQGGLGLPEKDFYFRSDDHSQEIRKQYVAHIVKMFVLLGRSQVEANNQAAIVMNIETALAKASLDVTSCRDPQKMVHMESVVNLQCQ